MRRTALGTIGSGNVFADLGLPDPDVMLLKANIVIEIDETIGKRGLTHVGAARLLGMPVAELTELLRGRTRPYTVDRLQELLRRLSA